VNNREAVIATLRHQQVEFVPGWTFFSTPQAEKLFLPEISSKNKPGTGDDYKSELAKATNSCFVEVSGGIQGKVVEEKKDSLIVELANGTRRLIVLEPEWAYQTLSRPLDGHKNLDKLNLPDQASNPEHWVNTAKSVKRFIGEGFFVRGCIDGFYAGIWEHCRQIDEFLIDLAEGGDFVQDLVDTWGKFLFDGAEKLLECGVDAVWWTDDLGSNTGPLMSPKCYRKYFFPWHKRTASLAHKYGKFAFMHSHGNINALLPDIVETGIDMLDPVGPSDGMDIKHLKECYGNRLCFAGGISRFVADMSKPELGSHIEEVYRSCKGGGFIPWEEGGIPKDMTKDNFEHYLKIRSEMSKKYAG